MKSAVQEPNSRGAAGTVLGAGLLTILLALAAFPAAAADTAQGAAVYKDKCIGCHAADGSGNTPMGKAQKAGDLRSAEIQAKTDAQLAETIAKGKKKMEPFAKKLSPAEIAAVVVYIRTLAKPKA